MNVHDNNFLVLLKKGLESIEAKDSLTNLKIALRMFNQQADENGYPEVANLADFLEGLTKIKASDFFDECEIDCCILTKSFKLASKLKEVLDEIHIYEKQQEMMRDILVKIRNSLEEIETKEYRYRLIRKFVSEHYLEDQLTFDNELEHKLTKELFNDVHQMYLPYQVLKEEVTCCPICHRIIEEEKCREVCHYYMKKEKKVFYQRKLQSKRKYFYLCEGIYRYTLMPAIGENRIFNQLKLMIGEEGEIQLYPNVDEYDIEVELNNKVYQLDVKDFQDPMQLAHKFKEENDISKMMSTHKRKRYLVIPTHRIEIYNKAANKSYINETKKLFKNLAPGIEVISEKGLYKMIRRELENE